MTVHTYVFTFEVFDQNGFADVASVSISATSTPRALKLFHAHMHETANLGHDRYRLRSFKTVDAGGGTIHSWDANELGIAARPTPLVPKREHPPVEQLEMFSFDGE